MQKAISIFYATFLILVLFVQSGMAASIEKELGNYVKEIGEKRFTDAMEIHIKGEIEAGDYEKFTTATISNFYLR